MKRLLRYVSKSMTASLLITGLTSPFTFAQKGEGQTLPSSVWRARYIQAYAHGNTEYNSKSQKIRPGYDVYIGASVAVLEYGLTDKLTVQTKIPFKTTNSLRIGDLENSSLVDDYLAGAAKKIATTGVMTEAEAFAHFKNNGLLPLPDSLTLASGEKITANDTESLKSQVQRLVRESLKKVEKGPTGIGDIELGALYNWYKSDRYLFSTGLGVRLPTGKYNVPEKLRPLGSGLTEAALRVNADYTPLADLCFSLQHQLEHALNSTSFRHAKLLDPSEFIENIASTTLRKSGFTHKGLAKIDFGFAALSKALKAVSVNTSYNFTSEAPTYLADNQNVAKSKRSIQHALGAGVSLDGLAYGWPVGLDVDYNTTVAGRDMALAADSLMVTAKAYARF